MSTIDYPLGGTMTFTSDQEVDIGFTPAPITKAEARQIGMDFCEASDPEREALLATLGPVMIRRGLLVLSNLALGLNDDEAAACARDLRDSITTRDETEAAS